LYIISLVPSKNISKLFRFRVAFFLSLTVVLIPIARPYAPMGRMPQEALGPLAPGQRANAPSNAGDMLTWDRYMGRQGYWMSSGLVADVVNVLKAIQLGQSICQAL